MTKRKYIVKYREGRQYLTAVVEATSKYDAKQRFYRDYPDAEIITIVEVEDEQR